MATNVLLRDMNIPVRPQDDRRLEIVANGLPLWGGAQIAVDATLVSPVRRNGRPQSRCASEAGARLEAARQKKEDTYRELLASRRCRLQVAGLEVGGRWDKSACTFLRLLARARVRAVPAQIRKSAQLAYLARWSGIVSVAASKAFAASLLHLPLETTCNVDGEEPDISAVLDDARYLAPPAVSRLPARG